MRLAHLVNPRRDRAGPVSPGSARTVGGRDGRDRADPARRAGRWLTGGAGRRSARTTGRVSSPCQGASSGRPCGAVLLNVMATGVCLAAVAPVRGGDEAVVRAANMTTNCAISF